MGIIFFRNLGLLYQWLKYSFKGFVCALQQHLTKCIVQLLSLCVGLRKLSKYVCSVNYVPRKKDSVIKDRKVITNKYF